MSNIILKASAIDNLGRIVDINDFAINSAVCTKATIIEAVAHADRVTNELLNENGAHNCKFEVTVTVDGRLEWMHLNCGTYNQIVNYNAAFVKYFTVELIA